MAPAAHYLCGGIEVDKNAESSIDRLYASGECARTGLHRANRLASNSLIEAIVYADSAAKHAVGRLKDVGFEERIPLWNDEGTRLPEEMILITQSAKEVGQIMSSYVGIVRSNLRLKRALTVWKFSIRKPKGSLYVRLFPKKFVNSGTSSTPVIW